MSQVAGHLKVCLANTYALYLKTQNYHWNVSGSNFSSLHALFEGFYKDHADEVDELAERIVTLGEKAPGGFGEFLSLMTLAEAGKNRMKASEMIQDLIETHEKLLLSFKEVLKVASKENDVGTEDLLTPLISAHEKKVWMLRAHLA